MAGDPKLEASQNIPDFPYARYGEMIGFRGIRMEKPEDVVPGWEAALRSDRPCVVEAVVDPEVPPLPPHITFQEAKGLSAAIVRGDPETRHMIRQIAKDWWDSVRPKKG
jgi:pyruvate dehydrogenase (quinone)